MGLKVHWCDTESLRGDAVMMCSWKQWWQHKLSLKPAYYGLAKWNIIREGCFSTLSTPLLSSGLLLLLRTQRSCPLNSDRWIDINSTDVLIDDILSSTPYLFPLLNLNECRTIRNTHWIWKSLKIDLYFYMSNTRSHMNV